MNIPARETAITGICLAILLGLGTWQVERLQWKERVIADLQTLYDSSASLPSLSEETLNALDQENLRFAYGHIDGTPEKDKAVLVGPVSRDGRMGYNLLVPLKTEHQKDVIVNAGWVDDLWKDTLEERLGIFPARVTIKGLARKPDWSRFASKNSPENNLWFRPDPAEIARAKELGEIHGTIVYADRIDPPLQDVIPQEEKWYPRNMHRQYAIFWYGMAVILLAVYGFYLRGLTNKKAP